MAADPKDASQPDINVYVSQLCEELRALKQRTNILETQVLRAPGAETFSPLVSAASRANRLLSFDATGHPQVSAPVSGDYSEVAVQLGLKLPKDGTEAMTGPLQLPGNASGALHAVPLQQLKLIANTIVPPGTITAQARLVAPDRWLLVDGKTVGNASSGATARANNDTWWVYEQLWAFDVAAIPIYDNTGAATTRGASAAADFAAGKRLPLFTPDGGAFIRMWAPGQTRDAGRAAGSVQEDEFEAHYHDIRCNSATGSGTGGGGYFISDAGVGAMEKTRATPSGGSETRPYNLSMPHYIFLGVAT